MTMQKYTGLFRKFFARNFRRMMLMMTVPLILLSVIINAIVMHNTTGIIERSNEFQFRQSEHITQLVFQSFDAVNVLISSNNAILNALRKTLVTGEMNNASFKQLQEMNNSILSIVASNSIIDSIYIYMPGGHIFYSTEGMLTTLENAVDTAWLDPILSQSEDYSSTLYLRQIPAGNDFLKPRQVMTLYQNLYSSQKQYRGVVVINVNIAKFRDEVGKLRFTDDQEVFISDGKTSLCLTGEAQLDERILSASPEGEDSFPIGRGKDRLLVAASRIRRNGLRYYVVTPTASIYGAQRVILRTSILFLCLLTALEMFLSYRIALSNRRNISAIFEAFEAADMGREMPPLRIRDAEVYDQIIRHIVQDGILKRLMEVQISEKKYRMQVLEHAALQYQINPHFFLNSIRIIYWKAVETSGIDSEQARMLENLLDFTGYVLSPPSENVTLEEEIAHTQSYVDILKARHPSDLNVRWRVDPGVRGTLCPRLIIQPILENAYYHGVRNAPDSCLKTIWIVARRKGDNIEISVMDNGLGIPATQLEEIRRALADDRMPEKHIGIYNTHKRIALRFGEGYGVSVFSRLGLGTCVKLHYPLTEGNERENGGVCNAGFRV